VITLIALVIACLAAYLPHLFFGNRLSLFSDFMLGSILGGVAYVVAVYQLKKMRGDL
jgi:hypothetical protein